MWKPTKKQHLTNKKYVDEHRGSGSDDTFIVHCHTGDRIASSYVTAVLAITYDEAFADILAAYNNGKQLIARVTHPNGTHDDISFSKYNERTSHDYENFVFKNASPLITMNENTVDLAMASATLYSDGPEMDRSYIAIDEYTLTAEKVPPQFIPSA